MVNLSKFSETLNELMSEQDLTAKFLSEQLGIPAPTITRYKNGTHITNIKNLVAIADYFSRSTDFLLGLEPEHDALKFLPCPPFAEQLVRLTKHFELTYYAFYHKAKIPESSFFEWKNGSSLPSLENVVKIATAFDCRIDYILGRES